MNLQIKSIMSFMIFPKNLQVIYIFILVGILMGIGKSSMAQDNLSEDSTRLLIKSVIPDSFPEVVLVLKGEHQLNTNKDAIEVYENDVKINEIQFEGDRLNHQLKVAILFDCSEAVKNELDYAKNGASKFMKSLKYPGDSLILVNYGADVSNTDLNDNVEVMEMIMGSLESQEERVLYDALQVGIEALLPHSGRKIIVALVGGKDNGSETPLQTILQSADILDIPLYLIGLGEVNKEVLTKMAKTTGGEFLYAESPEDIEGIYTQISENLQEVYELTYLSPDTEIKPGDRRTIKVVINQGEEEISTKTSFRIPVIENEQPIEDYPIAVQTKKNYLGVIIAVIVLAFIFVGIVWWRRQKDAIGLIVPAITEIVQNPKKPEIRARVNIPLKDRPARFTIYSSSGVPIKDFVFSGGKRKVKIDISSLSDGIYYCVLSNGGLDSERKEMLIEWKEF